MANRWPLVATIVVDSGRSCHSTPFSIGRLSSVDAANAVCEISSWMAAADIFHDSEKSTSGKLGNSPSGSPYRRNRLRPHSISI